jgi:hypothetical protein
MGPGVYVCARYMYYPCGYRRVFELGSMNPRDPRLCVYAATEPEPTPTTTTTTTMMATCDFLVHLLATIRDDAACIEGSLNYTVPVSGPGLSHFFQESQDNLRNFTLKDITLNEEQIRALATTESRPGMEVILHGCRLLGDNGCRAAFVDCLQGERGPTQLIVCNIDCHVLAAALEGNSRITRLRPVNKWATGDTEMGAIYSSLAENKGLVKLVLCDRSISDENWTILCQSLKGHPTLTSLDLRHSNPRTQDDIRTELLAERMKENRVLLTIRLSEDERDDQIYAESILPRLETNICRPRVLRIKKANIALRRALLGRALQTESVRNESNLLWMFLSENQDVVVQSIE